LKPNWESNTRRIAPPRRVRNDDKAPSPDRPSPAEEGVRLVPWSYQPTPIPADHSQPDISVAQLAWFFDCSPRLAQRLVETKQVTSYKLGGKRRVDFDSAKRLRAELIQLGLQRPQTGKRKPGGQRKQAPTAVA
jgi:hypothetical protein